MVFSWVPTYLGQWFHSQLWPFASAHGDQRSGQADGREAKIKPVLICDPSAVTTAGGQHTASFLLVTLMIRRGFQTLSVLKFLRFLSVCAQAKLGNKAATVMNITGSQQDELTLC